MTTNSLTLPLPLTARPEGRRRLRFPGLPQAGLLAQAGRSSRRAERRLSKRARRGQRIVLGTPELPYEPLTLGGAPLEALRRFDGLAITIATRSVEILEQIDLLIELDGRHAVTVDLLIASLEPGSADLEESLRAAAALSAQGITTRIVLTDLSRLPVSAASAFAMHRLFEAARDCRAFDVTAAPEHGGDHGPWSRLLRCLRLELGFPRPVPGRG